MAQATAKEQELLELINRMRTHPEKELEILLNSSDPEIKAALNYFKVNIDTLKAKWSELKKVAPLAWSSELNQAASGHNDAMIKADQQSHQVTGELDLGGRLKVVGYDYTDARENIYAYAKSVVYAHAGFAIDWGNGPDGIQNPAGHRDAIMAPELREVGIAFIKETNPNTKVGESLVTQDFGTRSALDKKGWLLGVAFQDTDKDTYYDDGEGLKDVQVKITGTNFSKTIAVADAGGYQELLDPGNYQVDFIRDGKVVESKNIAIDAKAPENVKLDLVIPLVTLETDPIPPKTDTAVDSAAPATDPSAAPATTDDSVAQKNQVTFTSTETDPEPVTSNPTPDVLLVKEELNSRGNAPNERGNMDYLGANLQMDSNKESEVFDFRADNTQTDTPDLTTKKLSLDFAGVTADAVYRNYAGLYRVDDNLGSIGNLKPGDAGYMTAALKRSQEIGVEFDKAGLSPKTIQGGYIYAPFVVADGTVEQALKDPTKTNVYFNYKAANADGIDHIISLGANKFGFEDTWKGGDLDYNDLVFQVNAKISSVLPT